MVRRRTKKGIETKTHTFDLLCEGKRFFTTEQEALEAADIGMLENMSVTLGIYQCHICYHWHLTSLKA